MLPFFRFVHNDIGHITIKIFVFIASKANLFLCKNKYHAGRENTELYFVQGGGIILRVQDQYSA